MEIATVTRVSSAVGRPAAMRISRGCVKSYTARGLAALRATLEPDAC